MRDSCAEFSRRYFFKRPQGLERIIQKMALGRIGEDFFRPLANRTPGFQNPLGQFRVIKFKNRVLVENLPQRGSGYSTGKTSGRHNDPHKLEERLVKRRRYVGTLAYTRPARLACAAEDDRVSVKSTSGIQEPILGESSMPKQKKESGSLSGWQKIAAFLGQPLSVAQPRRLTLRVETRGQRPLGQTLPPQSAGRT
jgi:hypothetical protein